MRCMFVGNCSGPDFPLQSCCHLRMSAQTVLPHNLRLVGKQSRLAHRCLQFEHESLNTETHHTVNTRTHQDSAAW